MASAASLAAARSLNVATPLSSVAGKTTSDRVLFLLQFFFILLKLLKFFFVMCFQDCQRIRSVFL